MKTYCGKQVSGGCGDQTIWVMDSGLPKSLKIGASQKIHNHSDGFNWGYGGSGPAQTAVGILYDCTGDKELSERLHQPFKRAYVASWGAEWKLTETELRAWILANSAII